jgi:hypothetical protein
VASPADDEVVLAEALVRRSRWPWIVLVAVTLFLAALVSFRFTIAPRARTLVVNARIGPDVTVIADGRRIRAVDGLLSSEANVSQARQICGTSDHAQVPTADELNLSRSLLQVEVSGYGTRCIPEGQSSRFGDLLVTASAVGVQHVGTVSLHEIEVEVSPSTWDSFLQTVPTYLLAFVIGVMGSLVAATLFNRWEPRRRRKAKVAPPSAPLDAS